MSSPTLTPIPHGDVVAAIRAIARQLETGDWQPDFLIGVGRGGLVPAVFLSHATGIPMLSVDYSTKLPGFSDDLLVKLAARSRDGARLLVIDDINDSGTTIAELRAAFAAAGADPDRIRFAVLIDNCRSRQQVDYRSRTIDRAETKDWFVFPWEAMAPVATIVEDAAALPARLA